MYADEDIPIHVSEEGREYRMPPLIWKGLEEYRVNGRGGGGFLGCVLANDLSGAVLRADPMSMRSLRDIVKYLHNELPSKSFGSLDEVIAYRRNKEKEREEDDS